MKNIQFETTTAAALREAAHKFRQMGRTDAAYEMDVAANTIDASLTLTEQERDTLVLILRDWLDHDNMNHSDPGQQAAVAILQRLGVEYERP